MNLSTWLHNPIMAEVLRRLLHQHLTIKTKELIGGRASTLDPTKILQCDETVYLLKFGCTPFLGNWLT